MQTFKCRVCGARSDVAIADVYRIPKTINSQKPGVRFVHECYDCPHCKCQNRLNVRYESTAAPFSAARRAVVDIATQPTKRRKNNGK